MATVTGLTAERMIQIERSAIVGARKEAGNLVLSTKGGDDIVAGSMEGLGQGDIVALLNTPASQLAVALKAFVAANGAGGFSGGVLDGGTF